MAKITTSTSPEELLRAMHKVVDKALESPDFQKTIINNLDAGEEVAVGPVWTAYMLQELLGDQVIHLPIPGSKEGDNMRAADKYVTTDSAGKPLSSTWYKDFFNATEEGEKIAAILLALDQGEQVPPVGPYAAESSERIDTLRKRYTARRRRGITLLEKAAECIILLEGFKDLNGVEAWYETEQDGRPTLTSVPFMVADKARGKFRPMTVTDFLRLDLDVAKSKGGKWEDVLASAASRKRESDPENKTDAAKKAVMAWKFDTGIGNMNLLLHWLDLDDVTAKLLKAVGPKAEGSDDIVETIGDLFYALKELHNEKRYNDIHQAQLDAERKAAAASK